MGAWYNPCIRDPLKRMHSFRRQLYSTHVRAVCWEPHCRSPTDVRGEGGSGVTLICVPVNTNLKQEAHIHQPTAWQSNCPWLPLPGRGMAVGMREVLARLCTCVRYVLARRLGSVSVSLALYLSSR